MFEIREEFYLNDKPFKIISGAFHYFRTVPEYWRDRLEKLVNMGCNTVETYIPWNYHEAKKGCFDFEGSRDICRFIETAKELGLYMIIRPSPYICAEWEFGGLPAWLLADKNMRLRCSYKPYLDAVKAYYDVLIPKLAPYQIDNGGNIILIQIENEYGYYGDDKNYLAFLRDTMRELGITVPFVTSDGPWSEHIFKSGMLDGALPTGNFGSAAEWQFGEMKKFIGENKPLMCMEFWNGWFDAWGEEHHTTSPEKTAAELDELLKRGSLSFYMFEGGTNFGFMNGRNGGSRTGDVTSYDYDAPLTEDGQITAKYELFRDVISKYAPVKSIPITSDIKRCSYGEISCTGKVGLFPIIDEISKPVSSPYPLTMEEIDQNYGYILYTTDVRADEALNELRVENGSDRVQVFCNGEYVYTDFAENRGEKFEPEKKYTGGKIQLLCENMGRENFGTGLENQRKGIIGGLKINDHRHFNYSIYPLELAPEQLDRIHFVDFDDDYTKSISNQPAFYRFDFDIDECGDTFVDMSGFGKGNVFINGFNLGRFWDIGPQKRLYLPAPLLKKGGNTIIIFETEGKRSDTLKLCDEPLLG